MNMTQFIFKLFIPLCAIRMFKKMLELALKYSF